MTQNDDIDNDWQPDSYYSIRGLNVASETYVFVGKGGPPGSKAVSLAKKKYAEDHDVRFRHLTAKKIGTAPGRSGGSIVAVFERLVKASHGELP